MPLDYSAAQAEVTRLHKEVTAILRTPDVRDRLAADSAVVVASSPEQFAEFVKAEMVKWVNVAKAAHPAGVR